MRGNWTVRAVAVVALMLAACGGEPGEAASHDEGEKPTQLVFGGHEMALVFTTSADDVEMRLSPILEAPEGATRIGLLIDTWEDGWVDPALLVIDGRGVNADGTTGPWIASTYTWADYPHVVSRVELDGEYAGAQLRMREATLAQIANLTWSAVIPDDAPSSTTTTVQSPINSVLAGANVQPRSAWGARKTKCGGSDGTKTKMAIHHTVTPTTAWGTYEKRLASIQAYHMDTRGWCDIGYHLLVTADGRIWEGRPIQHNGAHVGGHNTKNIGISFVGCFHSSGCASFGESTEPPTEMLFGAAGIIAHLSKYYGIAVSESKVKGHRDHSGAWSTCPGDYLWAELPTLRDMAQAIINGQQFQPEPQPEPEPTPVEPEPTPEPEPEPQPAPTVTANVRGVVWDQSVTSSPNSSGNKRVVTATVTAGETTTQVRAGDAYWNLKLPIGKQTLVFSAPGFQSVEKEIDVVANTVNWASTGMYPEGADRTLAVVAFVNANGGFQAVSGPLVHVEGIGAAEIGNSGTAAFTLEESEAVVRLYAAGYAVSEEVVTVAPGATETVYVELVPGGALGNNPLQGVVWDAGVTSGPSDSGNVRLEGTVITCSCGDWTTAREGDAYWSFDVAPGTHTVTAIREGFATATKTVTVTQGGDAWGSVGLE